MLTRGTENPIQVEHTAETDHFFLQHEDRGFELVYHGSDLIVSLLEMHQIIEKTVEAEQDDDPASRELAFFDKHGNFYGPVLLRGMYKNAGSDGPSRIKHTAVFEPAGKVDEAFTIPIDDIYCLSLAKPADE
ncbi:MAG TPA: hypothetical protein VM535_00100 [Candidatus Saccharimonadales bacterium]|nr:hypothetical protein [Candidatus Saccharimonadales bacterium]